MNKIRLRVIETQTEESARNATLTLSDKAFKKYQSHGASALWSGDVDVINYDCDPDTDSYEIFEEEISFEEIED